MVFQCDVFKQIIIVPWSLQPDLSVEAYLKTIINYFCYMMNLIIKIVSTVESIINILIEDLKNEIIVM